MSSAREGTVSAQRWGWVSESPADFLFHGLHALHMRRHLTSWDQKGALHFRHARHPTLRTSRGGLWSQSNTGSRRTPPSHSHAGGIANPKLSCAWAGGATARLRAGATLTGAGALGCCCTPCAGASCVNHGGRIAVTCYIPGTHPPYIATLPKPGPRASGAEQPKPQACPLGPACPPQSGQGSGPRTRRSCRRSIR